MSRPLEARFSEASKMLKALSHELRLEMLCGLRHRPCTQTFIASKLDVPQSTVAQHLKVLRSQGLVKAERHGVEVIFSLSDTRIEQILDTLCSKEDPASATRYSWDEIAAMERVRRGGDAI